jgi:hypothetical protein
MCCCELVAEEHFYQSLGLLTKIATANMWICSCRATFL